MPVDYSRLSESLDADCLQMADAAVSDCEAVTKAARYWLWFPQLLELYGVARGSLSNLPGKNGAYWRLMAAHQAAASLLVGVAESHGIAGGSIGVSASVCRSLCNEYDQFFPADWKGTPWPYCLGDQINSLSEPEQSVVLDGQVAFEEINGTAAACSSTDCGSRPSDGGTSQDT